MVKKEIKGTNNLSSQHVLFKCVLLFLVGYNVKLLLTAFSNLQIGFSMCVWVGGGV